MNCAAISATSASKLMSQPYSCAYSAPWREMTQPMSPGRWLRSRTAGRLLRRRLQRLFDRGHGADDGGACRGVETAEQRRDLVTRSVVEFGERRATPRGQGELGDAAVGLRGLARHDLAPLQRPQGAAEKSGVEAERTDQVGGGTALALRDLVDDPRFLQRPATVQQLRLDDAELAGVEPAEAANGGNLVVSSGIGGYV